MFGENSYSETFETKYGEGDCLGRIRPAILMRYVEHVALKHSALLGVTEEFNRSYRMVFLIAKQAIEFTRMPRAGETLTFVTEPEHSKRITFRRVTVIYDAQGIEVACVDSIWVLMDIGTHKLLRRSPVAFDKTYQENIPRSVEMKITKEEMPVLCGEVTASYALCDTNGHVNNVNYFDIACNLLPLEQLTKQNLKRIVLNYHRELLLNDKMQVRCTQHGDEIHLLGEKENAAVFEALCVFEPHKEADGI